jgi:hypothetical protein
MIVPMSVPPETTRDGGGSHVYRDPAGTQSRSRSQLPTWSLVFAVFFWSFCAGNGLIREFILKVKSHIWVSTLKHSSAPS